MNVSINLLLFVVITFYFSEGKPCPEETRLHQTRCDTYFRCAVVPNGSHVWIPTQCERGLVYEPNLRLCVLPGDDWECNLGEDQNSKQDNRNDFDGLELYPIPKRREPLKISNTNFGDVEKEFFEVKSGSDSNVLISSETLDSDEELFESSGDGDRGEILEIEVKESEGIDLPMESKIDPEFSSQLQRLSQLIDGLKSSYQNKGSQNPDLRPDQLNAFLAHYKLKSDFNSITPDYEKQQIPENGKIQPEVLREILQKQERLNSINKINLKSSRPSSTKIKVANTEGAKGGAVGNKYSASIKGKPSNSGGHSSSQIVVNRPEGSVVFSLPSGHTSSDNSKYEPKISEETLKTVLELSKQMMNNHNIRQVIPNNGFYQPFVQPFYYPVPMPSYERPPHFSDNDDSKYEKISSASYVSNFPSKNRPTTIIQNSVIPVHINKPPKPQIAQELPNNNKQIVDSYGNSISEYVDYPPYPDNQFESNGYSQSYQKFKEAITEKPLIQTTPSYFTPSPHLDNSNAHKVVSIDRYPTLSQASVDQYTQTSHHVPVPLFLPHINPSNVKIRPNSYSSPESAEQFAQSEDHTHDSVNNEIVNNLLAPNVDHSIHTGSSLSNQLVNLGGSFISLDVYKNQILPTLSGDSNKPSNVEVISCSAAVRQANISDCTKYYVCSKNDGKVLSYSCPPYTAFNAHTRICDSKTYAICNPEALFNRFTVAENRKIQMEALKALQEAKRIRDEAIQAQNLANLIRLETQKVINNTITDNKNQMFQEPAVLMSDYMSNIQPLTSEITTTSTPLPPLVLYNHKRKKYYCKEGDKIPDQTSVLSYYVCYKTKDGIMKGHKMTCSSGLMFCARTALCTLPRKCNA